MKIHLWTLLSFGVISSQKLWTIRSPCHHFTQKFVKKFFLACLYVFWCYCGTTGEFFRMISANVCLTANLAFVCTETTTI